MYDLWCDAEAGLICMAFLLPGIDPGWLLCNKPNPHGFKPNEM